MLLFTYRKDPTSNKAVESCWIDSQRQARGSLGMAQRPERDLQTARWAGPLRAEWWIIPVLQELVWFAASVDECAEEWPYDRIADRVPGLPLAVDKAIAHALSLLITCRPEWFENNIGRPMSSRMLMPLDAVRIESMEQGSRDDAFLVRQPVTELMAPSQVRSDCD